MPLTAPRRWFWTMSFAALLSAAPAMAEMIRFGYGGSIHGGATWEIRPDDSVTFAAYQARADLTLRPDWVWDAKDLQPGHITFALPGAFAGASEIVVQRIGKAKLGPAPAYVSNCTDAGYFVVEVEIPGLTYRAIVDACIAGTDHVVPKKVLRHYRALQAATDAIIDTLGPQALF